MPDVITALALLMVIAIIYFALKKPSAGKEISSDAQRKILEEHVEFYQELSVTEKKLFEEDVSKFLKNVKITGVNTEVEDMDQVFVAAAAVIPIFAFRAWEYRNINEVLLYPDNFSKEFAMDGDGRGSSYRALRVFPGCGGAGARVRCGRTAAGRQCAPRSHGGARRRRLDDAGLAAGERAPSAADRIEVPTGRLVEPANRGKPFIDDVAQLAAYGGAADTITGRLFGSGRFGARGGFLVDHADLHPHRLGADRDRFIDRFAGCLRAAEDVDDVDRLADLGELAPDEFAVDMLAGDLRVDWDDTVPVGLHEFHHAVGWARRAV